MSSQPQRRGRPVTAPYSLPRARRCFADRVVNLGGERALADARDISLGHGDDGADGRGPHAGSGGRAARRRRRRGHKRIGAVVDVEHGALRALKHHAAALGENLFSRRPVSATKGRTCSAAAAYSSYIFAGSSGSVPKSAWAMAFFSAQAASMCVLSSSGVQQVDDAQAAAGHLVFVGRADAPAGGADLLAAGRALGGQLDHAVVGQNHLGAIGDEELPIDVDAELAQLGDFLEEGDGVEHHAVADDALAARAAERRRESAAGRTSGRR